MEIQIKQIQLTLNAPLGPLNDVRKQRVAESIGSGRRLCLTPLS